MTIYYDELDEMHPDHELMTTGFHAGEGYMQGDGFGDLFKKFGGLALKGARVFGRFALSHGKELAKDIIIPAVSEIAAKAKEDTTKFAKAKARQAVAQASKEFKTRAGVLADEIQSGQIRSVSDFKKVGRRHISAAEKSAKKALAAHKKDTLNFAKKQITKQTKKKNQLISDVSDFGQKKVGQALSGTNKNIDRVSQDIIEKIAGGALFPAGGSIKKRRGRPRKGGALFPAGGALFPAGASGRSGALYPAGGALFPAGASGALYPAGGGSGLLGRNGRGTFTGGVSGEGLFGRDGRGVFSGGFSGKGLKKIGRPRKTKRKNKSKK